MVISVDNCFGGLFSIGSPKPNNSQLTGGSLQFFDWRFPTIVNKYNYRFLTIIKHQSFAPKAETSPILSTLIEMFPLLTAVNLLSVTALPFLFGTDLMTKPVEVLLATSVALLGVIYLCTRAVNVFVYCLVQSLMIFALVCGLESHPLWLHLFLCRGLPQWCSLCAVALSKCCLVPMDDFDDCGSSHHHHRPFPKQHR